MSQVFNTHVGEQTERPVLHPELPKVLAHCIAQRPSLTLEFYGGYKKGKGRDWLADSGANNALQPQTNATVDETIVHCP